MSGDDGDASDERRQLERELAALRQEFARVRGVLREAEARRIQAEKQLVAAKAENGRYVAQLKALRMSGSWRVTRPLRITLRERRLGQG